MTYCGLHHGSYNTRSSLLVISHPHPGSCVKGDTQKHNEVKSKDRTEEIQDTLAPYRFTNSISILEQIITEIFSMRISPSGICTRGLDMMCLFHIR